MAHPDEGQASDDPYYKSLRPESLAKRLQDYQAYMQQIIQEPLVLTEEEEAQEIALGYAPREEAYKRMRVYEKELKAVIEWNREHPTAMKLPPVQPSVKNWREDW